MKMFKLTIAALALTAAATTVAFADSTTGATATYQSASSSTTARPVLTDAEKYIINQMR